MLDIPSLNFLLKREDITFGSPESITGQVVKKDWEQGLQDKHKNKTMNE